MMTLDAVPKLVAKARLRFDARRAETLLLWPERGLRLNKSAAEILQLCTGERTVRDLVAHLAARHREIASSQLEKDVIELLQALLDRGLLEVRSS